MRIISGKYRGRKINPPNNIKARPTTDFAKESLFNMLNTRVAVDNAVVLDLFAGCGGIGFECVSRGARMVISVDIALQSHKFITKFAREMGMTELRAIKSEGLRYLRNTPHRFNIIFADPPYDMPGIEKIPEIVFEKELLEKDGLLIVEHSRNTNFSEHRNFTETRKYGKVNFSFFSA